MIGLLGLAFASALAALALLAILTLLLLVIALLLVRPALLVLPVGVTALVLHHADLVRVVLARAMANRVRLELRDNCSAHIAKLKIFKVVIASDDSDEHLPSLRECGQGNHHLELRGDCNARSLHAAVSHKGLVEVGIRVSSQRDATIKAVFEVLEDGGSRRLAIEPLQSVLEREGGDVGLVVLLNSGCQPKHDLPQYHSILPIEFRLAS
jgi:hypothetical protein